MNLIKLALLLGVTTASGTDRDLTASADEDSASSFPSSDTTSFQQDSVDDPSEHVWIPEGYYTLCTSAGSRKMTCLAERTDFKRNRDMKYVYALKQDKQKAAVYRLTYPDANVPDFQLECATCTKNDQRSGKIMTSYHTLVYEPLNVDSQTYDSTIQEATFWAKRANGGLSKDTFKIRTSEHHFVRKWLTPSKLPLFKNVIKLSGKIQGTASWTLYPVDMENRVVESKPFTLDV